MKFLKYQISHIYSSVYFFTKSLPFKQGVKFILQKMIFVTCKLHFFNSIKYID